MNETPQQKRKVGIRYSNQITSLICFNTDQDTAADLKQYGQLTETIPRRYELWVDACYDFQEVLNHITNLE